MLARRGWSSRPSSCVRNYWRWPKSMRRLVTNATAKSSKISTATCAASRVMLRALTCRRGTSPTAHFFSSTREKWSGTARLRHQLTPALEHEGGHIGYDIRPSARRRGFGTLILALTLERARILGLARALLTCDTDNTASARIIERNGGALAARVVSNRTGKLISQYWIEL
ncbi:MAG TPA: GNAT family N-acetyltransferase [Pyrinomonadaceae bacterium]|nr:GNAT family N-acetyltransferase [Pyrinomonadaceae bacterium]